MAHSSHEETQRLAAFAAAVVVFVAQDAHALAFGEPRVRSSLGAPLELHIPVTLGSGEWIEPSCFKLIEESVPGSPRISGGRVSLRRSASGTLLLVETRSSISDPVTALGVVASCKGLTAEARRDYSLSIAAAPKQPVPGPQAQAPSIRDIAATLIARVGDTLQSIARAIFPGNGSAQRAYIGAMREANPALASLRADKPIEAGTRIALPDLRTFSKSRPVHEASPPSPARSTKSAPPSSGAKSEPASAPARSPTAAPASRAEAPPPTRRARNADGFALKLSAPQVDLTPSRTMDERKRAQLRERQLILDTDDQVAAVLALRHSVKQLESRLAELQLKVASMPPSFPPPKAEAQPAAKPSAKPAAPTPVTRDVSEEAWFTYGLWGLAALFIIAAIYLAWRLRKRRQAQEQRKPRDSHLRTVVMPKPEEPIEVA